MTPDASLVVIAALFGGRTAAFGVLLLARAGFALVGRSAPALPTRWRTGLRLVAAVLVLSLAVATGWLSNRLRGGPEVGPFYDTPATLPATAGQLIRSEPYVGDLPPGLTGDRLYYTTSNAAGTIVPSSGVLVVPTAAKGPVPLISWAHGTVGVARACAPSIGPDAVQVTQLPDAERLAELGWALVATDYPGMGAEGVFPYLIGQGEGRAVLDAARAARQLPAVQLTDQTVIWGHSQGGHAAEWAGQLAQNYASDLTIVGTAALSPASDPYTLAESVLSRPDAVGASLAVSYVVNSYTDYYPELDLADIVSWNARAIVKEAAARCTSQAGTLVTALTGLAIANDDPIVDVSALAGPFGVRLHENTATGPFSAPVFLGQGEADEVIPWTSNQTYSARLCDAGVTLETHGYPGGTHMSVLDVGSQLSNDLVAWTTDRFAGKPTRGNCR